MLEIPDNLHNVIALLCAGLLVGFAWSIGAFAAGLLSTNGKIVALVVLLIVLVILVFGKV
jgi:hypothetical protein